MRAAIYARYSSDSQRDASIEDQVRICRAELEKLGAGLIGTYTDHAISGSTRLRPGYQKLLEDARAGAFDVVVAEALDRISRDQEDVASCFKILSFANAKIHTISEGLITELHVGLKGTMNALFLKDLAQKTHRGLEGRVKAGHSAGGRAFGYKIDRRFNPQGEPVAGVRTINGLEAATIQRIFQMFVGGTSPNNIAKILNAEGVPGPGGRRWSESTIRGHEIRRTGLLRNDLFRGELIWNKQRYVKDPTTGKRLARPNPKSAWVRTPTPDLRIVDEKLWATAQEKLGAIGSSPRVLKAKAKRFWENRRPRHLLTGIATCGKCGGTLASIGKDYLTCSRAHRLHDCENRKSLRRPQLEDAVLAALRDNLMTPAYVETFVEAYHAELNAQAAFASGDREAAERNLVRTKRQIEAIIDSIAEGYRTEGMKQRLEDLEDQRVSLERRLAEPEPSTIRLHPALPQLYREKVQRLTESLSEPSIRDEAITLLRQLIEAVTIFPTENGWEVEIKGEIGRMTNLAEGRTEQNQCSVKVVAGAEFEQTTFRL